MTTEIKVSGPHDPISVSERFAAETPARTAAPTCAKLLERYDLSTGNG